MDEYDDMTLDDALAALEDDSFDEISLPEAAAVESDPVTDGLADELESYVELLGDELPDLTPRQLAGVALRVRASFIRAVADARR